MGLGFIALLAALLLAILFAASRPLPLRRWLLGGLFALLNLAALAAAVPAYLVTRLDGSRPPTIGEFLAPHGFVLLLLLVFDVAIIYLWQRQPVT